MPSSSPSLALQPGGPGGQLGGPRGCGALLLSSLLASLLGCRSAVRVCLASQNFLNRSLCRCLVCATLGFACDGGLCAVQLLLSGAALGLSLPPSFPPTLPSSSLGDPVCFSGLVLCPFPRWLLPSPWRPPLGPGYALQAAFTWKFVEA